MSTKQRSYTKLYKMYWRALRLGHLSWAGRLHELAHAAARQS